MTTDGERSFVTFLYADIQWQTTALASVGHSVGVTLPGSGTQAIRDLVTTSNVRVDGLWMYRVDTDIISGPP